MTGNTKVWRAPLAGLASVAMIATMGVAASTANAAAWSGDTSTNYKINVYDPDQPWKPTTVSTTAKWGTVLTPLTADPYAASGDGKVFDYFSYDKAGKEKIGDVVVVKGATKVFAQYKQAVEVAFDVNGDGTYDPASEPAVDIAKGSALTAADYRTAFPSSEPSRHGEVFAGWTYTHTQQGSSDDLYTDAAINEDTVLHARFDVNQNLSTVGFRTFATESTTQRYTLAGNPFPQFRVPSAWSADTKWQTEDQKAYDFTQPVPNKDQDGAADDLVLVAPVSADLKNVTVKYDFAGAVAPTAGDYTTTADEKPVQPVEPVAFGKVFTGWFTYDGKKIDFTKPISEQANFNATSNEITLHARWDTTHVAELVYNLGYQTPDYVGGGKQFEFVYAGEKKDLPAGLEEYYQTAAQEDAAKDEYTTRKLTGWYQGSNDKDVVTSANALAAGSVTEFTAVWDASYAVRLNGNGGKFDGQTYKWVTAAKDTKLADILVEPVRDGYTLAYWVTDYGTSTEAKVDTSKTIDAFAGKTLTAKWTASAKLDVDALRNQFPLVWNNQSSDALTVAAYGYTDASAKAYVKAVYALEDEYAAYQREPESQKKVDLATALQPKYEAAQKLLVKANGAEVPSGKVAVYRAFNPNETRGGSHLYTTDFTEYSNVVRAGWRAEGVQFQTTSSKKATPVYRTYNPNDGSHHYTTDKAENDGLVAAGWTYEDVAWYVDDDAPVSVYRAYNPNSGEHVFTTDKAEYDNLVNVGWRAEDVAFKAYAK
ncbi:InlB B-repeat-containing protein [Bifidobacterium sp. UTBIF-78]|uniref:InlB B-repeat-containing protein n=1 Tax=Bifidobacterium sp. UTBIF-78 TaxID=1465263 RepID=UPI0015E2EDA1|nr:InlB B-repeat-containing protein [Bifidobacterium sp. UTBIF-78]TPF91714.1 hypothetical protein BG22_10625 [Bifidobacterium sp. UTBIF-78]